VVSTRECERNLDCSQVVRATHTDYSIHDVILVSPAELKMSLELRGPPTTLGEEWKLYRSLRVTCRSPWRAPVELAARADAGGGSVAYFAATPKLRGAKVICSCAE
jgi:hypothetical protein